MEISNIDVLVKYLASCTDESLIRSLITAYGNIRHAAGIEYEGRKSREFLAKINACKNKRIKNYILNWDEDNGAVTLKELTKYITGIDDELHEMMRHGDAAHCNAATDVSGIIWNRIGNIKIDRRLLFTKDEDDIPERVTSHSLEKNIPDKI